MVFRAALVAVLMLAISRPSIGHKSFARDCEGTIVTIIAGEGDAPRETMRSSRPAPNPLDDILGGRERNVHSRHLARIAIAVSLGDRDAVEIASGELRKFGVTQEDIQHFVDQAKLHSGSGSRNPPKPGCRD